MRWTGALSMAWLAMGPATAQALCYREPPGRTVVPGDGTDGWPVDAPLWVTLEEGWPAPAISAVSADYRLRSPDNETMVLAGVPIGYGIALRPEARLEASAVYTLERLHVYEDGQLASDGRLIDLLLADRPPSGDVARVWFPVARFRTEDAPGPRRWHGPVAVTRAFYEPEAGGLCGPAGESLWVAYELGGDVPVGSRIEVEVEGQGVVWRAPVAPSGAPTSRMREGTVELTDAGCAPQRVHVEVGNAPTVRMVVRKPDGGVAATSSWLTATRSERNPDTFHAPHAPLPDAWGRMRDWHARLGARVRMASFPIALSEPTPGIGAPTRIRRLRSPPPFSSLFHLFGLR